MSAKLQKAFDKVGIGIEIVNKETGDMASTYDILMTAAQKWDTLTDAQRQYIGELMAGKNQIANLDALMKNYQVAIDATETALNSAGSAEAENAKVLESVQGKIQELKKAFQDFALKTINSDFVKSILSAITNLIKFVDKIGGAKTILTAISVILASKFVPSLIKSTTSIASFITSLVSGNVVMTKFGKEAELSGNHTKSFGKHLNESTVYVNGYKVAVAGLTLALTAAVAIYSAYKQNQEELKAENEAYIQSEKEKAEALKEYMSTYGDLSQQKETAETDEERTNINKELLSLQEKIKKALGDQADAIDLINGKYEDQEGLLSDAYIKQLKKNLPQLKAAFQEAKNEFENYHTVETSLKGFADSAFASATVLNINHIVAGQETAIDKYNKLIELQKLFTQASYEGKKEIQGYDVTEGLSYVNAKISELEQLKNKVQETSDAVSETESKLANYTKLMDFSGTTVRTQEEYDALIDKINNYNSIIDLSGNSTELYKEKLLEAAEEVYPEFAEKTNEASNSINDFSVNLEKVNKAIDDTQNAMSVLDQTIYEYNSSEGLTVDTLQSLLSLGTDYLSMLEMQNGQLQLTAEGQDILTNSILNEMQAALASAAYNEILALAQGSVKDEAESSQSGIVAMGNALAASGNQASVAAGQFLEAARAMSQLPGGTDISGVTDEQINAVYTKYQGIMSNITSTTKSSTKGIGSGSYSGAAKKSSGSGSKKSSGSSSSKDTWKEAFEAKYKALQHELNMEQITEEQYTNELESLYKQYFSNKSKYLDEYNKYEEEVYKNRKKIVKANFDDELDALKHQLDMNMISERDYTDKLEALNKKYYANKKEFLDEYTKYEEEVYKNRMSYLKDDYNSAISVATNTIDKQIKALEEQKKALQKTNDETDRAIELEKLRNNLYNAQNQKNMRVYYEGIGWVWEADKQAIEEAKKALSEFELEEATNEIDNQINELEELKNSWSSISSDYENQQERINAAVQFGADFEKQVLSGRLDFLRSFASSYNEIMDSLNPQTSAQANMSTLLPFQSSYASGTTSAIGGLSLVGEQGAELRVLNQGDGIIPADLTQNLMNWGRLNPIDVLSGAVPISNGGKSAGASTTLNIGNVSLPNVSNGESFVKELKQFAITHNK